MLAALISPAKANTSRRAGDAAVSWANWQWEDSSQFSVTLGFGGIVARGGPDVMLVTGVRAGYLPSKIRQ
jgi:hypothetical protein